MLLVIGAGAAIGTILCVLLLDQPALRAVVAYEPSPVWDAGTTILEWAVLLPVHKLAMPVLLVGAMLATVLVERWRGAAPPLMTIAAVHLIARLVTNWIKDGTGRDRPLEAFAKGVEDTFGHGGIAFPSGHVVLFASLAIPIVYVVPAARRRALAIPLIGIVVFISAARIAVGAHWISDTLGSITLVVALTYLVSLATRPSR